MQIDAWIAPVMLLLGVLATQARQWLSSRGANEVSQQEANTRLLEQLYKRLDVVEEAAAKVPVLEGRLAAFEVENQMLREYVSELQRIMAEAGLDVPELVWPNLGRVM